MSPQRSSSKISSSVRPILMARSRTSDLNTSGTIRPLVCKDFSVTSFAARRQRFCTRRQHACHATEAFCRLCSLSSLGVLPAVLVQRNRRGRGDVVAVWQAVHRNLDHVVHKL